MPVTFDLPRPDPVTTLMRYQMHPGQCPRYKGSRGEDRREAQAVALTAREREVLELVAQGLNDATIAQPSAVSLAAGGYG